MKIIEYLQRKYAKKEPTTITKAEAISFGIPYPLTKGWLAKHGERTIDYANLGKLERKMQKRSAKQKRKNKKGVIHTSAALRIIGDVTCPSNPRYELTKDWWNTDLDKEDAEPKITKKVHHVSGNEFLRSYEWRVLRMQALKKYGARCQCCGATPESGAVMNVDHIKPRRIFPAMALSLDNLQILCDACNHGKGNWDMTDWREVTA